MFRCDVCGRLLAGLRADHVIQCRIARRLATGSPVFAPIVRRRRLVEGGPGDPFEVEEVPARTGVQRRSA